MAYEIQVLDWAFLPFFGFKTILCVLSLGFSLAWPSF